MAFIFVLCVSKIANCKTQLDQALKVTKRYEKNVAAVKAFLTETETAVAQNEPGKHKNADAELAWIKVIQLTVDINFLI